MKIQDREVGAGHPVYIIAEMSANHGQDFERAVKIMEAAHQSGADAIKVQTYLPETLTLESDQEAFRIKGTVWEDQKLFQLYQTAFMPWEWTSRLKEIAESLGMHFFSTAYDFRSVDFLEQVGIPVYKVASFENVDIPLLKRIAETGKPVILSTGMATLAEISEAVETLKDAGCPALSLLKCTSAYPALPADMNLRTIPHLAETFQVPAGLSDHSLELAVPVTAVALGASVIEKHFTLARSDGGPDSSFSLEPSEFKQMVDAIRVTEQALGRINYGVSEQEQASRAFRRSLFAVENIAQGELVTADKIRSIRPAGGLHTRHLPEILGRRAVVDIARGTPIQWELLGARS